MLTGPSMIGPTLIQNLFVSTVLQVERCMSVEGIVFFGQGIQQEVVAMTYTLRIFHTLHA